jgi:hypothetical protein
MTCLKEFKEFVPITEQASLFSTLHESFDPHESQFEAIFTSY